MMPCPNEEKPLQAIESLQRLFREMEQNADNFADARYIVIV